MKNTNILHLIDFPERIVSGQIAKINKNTIEIKFENIKVKDISLSSYKGLLYKQDIAIFELNRLQRLTTDVYFYVKKINNQKKIIYLSRISKNFVTGLLELFEKDTIQNFIKYNHTKPQFFSIRRVPNRYSIIFTDKSLLFKKDNLQKIRKILFNEKIFFHNA